MSVVFAQLYIGDKCHGVHCFVVPIRDPWEDVDYYMTYFYGRASNWLNIKHIRINQTFFAFMNISWLSRKTHATFAGVEAGDCGHKVGLQGIDNGMWGAQEPRVRINILITADAIWIQSFMVCRMVAFYSCQNPPHQLTLKVRK